MIGKIKEKLLQRRILADWEQAENEDIVRSQIELMEQEMTDHVCAVANFYNCRRDCVHFNKGRSIKGYKEEKLYAIAPECKLWRD